MLIKAALVAAVLLCVHQVSELVAHPGHGGRPDPVDDPSDCGNCGPGASHGDADRERSSDDTGTYAGERVTDAKALSGKAQVLDQKLDDAAGRVSGAQATLEQTGKVSAASRRQALRSIRGARRATQRLARDLRAFLDEYSDGLPGELRKQLNSDLSGLNAQAVHLKAQEVRLSNPKSCTSNQCAEVITNLYEQGIWSDEDVDLTELSSRLSAI